MSRALPWSRREVLKLGMVAGLRPAVALAQASPLSMPGLYPGKVVAIEHSGAYTAGRYQSGPIQRMIRQGLMQLTGAPDIAAAMRQFVQPGDVVGIKTNPNGNPLLVSSSPCYRAIITGLLLAGIKPQDIVVYERHAEQLPRIQGYFPGWVRIAWADPGYDDIQQDISGYDPDHYIDFPKVLPGFDPANPTARRSYAALFVTRMVNKVINVAILKTHQSAGVTLSLKNLSHGLANNAVRSHPSASQNWCGDYIPAVVSMPVIRNKAVLHIIDGIHGLYHSGPYGDPIFVWYHGTMYFATDPVALDRIAWLEIDRKRAAMGRPPVAQAPPDSYFGFLQTQPEHILKAGALGLGEWRDDRIRLQKVTLG